MRKSCRFGLSGFLLCFATTALAEEAVVRLSWAPVEGASAYQVQVSSDAFFSSTVVDVIVPGAAFDWPAFPTRKHYWRVRSLDEEGRNSAWSSTRVVQGQLEEPKLRVGRGDTSTGVWLSWSPVLGAERYVVRIDGRAVTTRRRSWRVRRAEAGTVDVQVSAQRGDEIGPSASAEVRVDKAPVRKAVIQAAPTLARMDAPPPSFSAVRPQVSDEVWSSSGRWDGPLVLAVSAGALTDFGGLAAPGGGASVGWAAPFGLRESSWELDAFVAGNGRGSGRELVQTAFVQVAAHWRQQRQIGGLIWSAALGPAVTASRTDLGPDFYLEAHPALVLDVNVGIPLAAGAFTIGAGVSAGQVSTRLVDVTPVRAMASVGFRFGGAQ